MIGIDKFGRDHWSLLAYIETLCVDTSGSIGTICRSRVRCNPEKHPLLSAGNGWDPKYSTRLSGCHTYDLHKNFNEAVSDGVVELNHDDWDCLDDLESNGLVNILSLSSGRVEMTEKGLKVSSELRTHKASGNNFATFKAVA